jgi:hypothetical protein
MLPTTVVDFVKNNYKTILAVIVAAISVYVLYKTYYPEQKTMLEFMEEVSGEQPQASGAPVLGDEFPVQSDSAALPRESSGIVAEDLLPKSQEAKDFEAQFPLGTGDLASKNFVVAGHNIGINTVSSSMKNANLQLRSDPFIEPKMVSPFLNSTITPDLSRKNFEIGA